MSKVSKSFHMQDHSSNDLVLPEGADREEQQAHAHATYVDMGDVGVIQTDPSIDYAQYQALGKGLHSSARLTDDGRIIIALDLKKKLPDLPEDYARDVEEFAVDERAWKDHDIPNMNIVIMIVGSRGDVQPYIALGKRLLTDGHRVRIATHATFQSFVRSAGLEFFNIGGDPQDLMSYMVKNPGLMPGFQSLTNGDIGRKRTMLSEMMNGCWRACYEPDEDSSRTFAADAIISNPPAFAHIHCAEALGVPLLLSFTMPWSPTKSFPHPLVNIKSSNAEEGLTNYLSYALAELLTWQGIGDITNAFRAKTLGLSPLSLRSGPGIADRLKVPYTYCLSPALVPKPKDWTNYIDVVGFYFLDLTTNYEPPEDLKRFLNAGPPPIFIGFGSVVVDDPKAMTDVILTAVKASGVRTILFSGWGGLGDSASILSDVFVLGKESNVPHDWLFKHVAAVVHHGGAGTTAAGLLLGRPTIVVPFFGDQLFWGMMIHRAGAGPQPIPQKQLSAQNLTAAIKYAVSPSAKKSAERLGVQIRKENGVERGLESFYKHLPLLNMRCDLDASRIAVWWSTEYCLRLSAFAAQVLADARQLDLDGLDAHRSKEYESRKAISDPITGGASAIFWTVTNWYTGIAQIFYSPVKGIIKTTTAIPRGIMDIITSVHEGFSNLPKLYGSDVREQGKVTGFKSGVKEAGKGFFYGYYDGITGLIREPVEGAKKEGFLGAIKGSARSFVNVTMRPAAGAVGLVAHPISGAWKSMQKSWARKQEQHQRTTRISDGTEAVDSSTASERKVILDRFKEAKVSTMERRRKYGDLAKKVLQDKGYQIETPSASTSAQRPMGTPPEQEAYNDDPASDSELELAKRLSLAEQNGRGQEAHNDDAAFERDLELAQRLSLAERNG